AARGMLAKMNVPEVGEVVVPGVVPRLSKTPGRITDLGPPLGSATEEVLSKLLGLSTADIDALRKQGVI
ncbi:MAG: CoA transferase, partial [Myxococcota bacterium]